MFRVYKTDKTSFYYFYFPNPWINGQLKYRLKLHTEQHWTSNHVKVKASNPMEIYSCSKKKWPKRNFSLLRVTSQPGGDASEAFSNEKFLFRLRNYPLDHYCFEWLSFSWFSWLCLLNIKIRVWYVRPSVVRIPNYRYTYIPKQENCLLDFAHLWPIFWK